MSGVLISLERQNQELRAEVDRLRLEIAEMKAELSSGRILDVLRETAALHDPAVHGAVNWGEIKEKLIA